MKKIKGDILDVKRNSIPKLGLSKEEREKNLELLEKAKKNQTKPAVLLPNGFNYTLTKKKTK